jgi:glycosyltransferase involved in cell wall biosynthesis
MAQYISYAILACNEHEELNKLLTNLYNKIRPDDEVIVLLDTNNSTSEVEDICKKYMPLNNFKYYSNPLNKDFANQKNELKKLCTKDWIFNIDADEYLPDLLLDNINDILELNIDVDLIAVPRVNKVIGLTSEHIAKWKWNVDSEGRVNYPDFQLRIFKNVSYIKWEGKVHEKPVGWKTGTHLPYESDDFAMIHIKEINRQEKQNALYDTI